MIRPHDPRAHTRQGQPALAVRVWASSERKSAQETTAVASVDATCARVIGLEPRRLLSLDSASAFLGNLDDARIDQRGEAPARSGTRFAVVESLRHLRDE